MDGGELQTTLQLGSEYDYLAPDTAEVRMLCQMRGAGVAHCMVPPQRATLAVVHRTVEEIWYVVAGRGRIWRCSGGSEEITELSPGLSPTVPTGTRFQFRCDGAEPERDIRALLGQPEPPRSRFERQDLSWSLRGGVVELHRRAAIPAQRRERRQSVGIEALADHDRDHRAIGRRRQLERTRNVSQDPLEQEVERRPSTPEALSADQPKIASALPVEANAALLSSRPDSSFAVEDADGLPSVRRRHGEPR